MAEKIQIKQEVTKLSTLIGLVIGGVSGILFTFAFPEPALAVNDTVSPYVQSKN